MKKKQVYTYLYYFLLVMWIVQIVVGGSNIHIVLPSICLFICYFLMKKSE